MSNIRVGDLEVAYAERGAGAPVIFVHGNWATKRWWEPVIERLPAEYRGIAYDMRGRGETIGPDNGYTIPELAYDLLAFADALGLANFMLVGHSLGSAVAMQFALEHSERVTSLAAVSPAWVDGMPAAYHVPAAQQAIKDDAALFAQALKPMAPTCSDTAFWEALVTESHGQRLEAALRNLDALVAWRPGNALQAIPVTKLVVSGELDTLTGGEHAQRAAQVLGARLVVIPGVGHSPNVEAPETLVSLLFG